MTGNRWTYFGNMTYSEFLCALSGHSCCRCYAEWRCVSQSAFLCKLLFAFTFRAHPPCSLPQGLVFTPGFRSEMGSTVDSNGDVWSAPLFLRLVFLSVWVLCVCARRMYGGLNSHGFWSDIWRIPTTTPSVSLSLCCLGLSVVVGVWPVVLCWWQQISRCHACGCTVRRVWSCSTRMSFPRSHRAVCSHSSITLAVALTLACAPTG